MKIDILQTGVQYVFYKTAAISARASLADAGKQGRHAHKDSAAILPGKTKEAGFTG